MNSLIRSRRSGALIVPLVLFVGMAVACGDDDDNGPTGPNPPAAFTIAATTNVDSVVVTWDALTGVDSFVVEITTNPTLTKTVLGNATQAIFTSDDDVEDGADYEASVTAYNEAGSTASSNNPTVTTDFFPWDENFATSLHVTGQGKQTFYNEVPNGGFEEFTGVPYADLTCKTCHEVATRGTCERCHDTATPGLGATIDSDDVCFGCHSRQANERNLYSDVHRDLGVRCMGCHTLEDVHGDGTAYASQLEDGAIDARCEDCHSEGNVPGPPSTSVTEHGVHGSTIYCSTCHMQSVVTCHNCHFESEVNEDTKRFFPDPRGGPWRDWIFLINYRDMIYPANFQSLKWGNTAVEADTFTFMAMAPYYAHTVTGTGRTCSDCHNNDAITDYNDDGVIDVMVWNDVTNTFDQLTGVIPIPPDPATSLSFDFVDYDPVGGTWFFLTTGLDRVQIPYGSALTAGQMANLGGTGPGTTN